MGAFRRLVFDYDAAILALALRIAASDREARRLYLETMLRIHQELPHFQFECAFYIWICRHFSAVSLDYLRSKRVVHPDFVDAALDALTPRERMVVELKHYQRESLETIGEMLGMSGEVASNALVRGMHKLRMRFNEHNPIDS